MALLTLTVKRPQDAAPTTWLFDDCQWHRRAKDLAIDQGILLAQGEDYITDFDEFAAWVRRDP